MEVCFIGTFTLSIFRAVNLDSNKPMHNIKQCIDLKKMFTCAVTCYLSKAETSGIRSHRHDENII